jgi:hypothetical protein
VPGYTSCRNSFIWNVQLQAAAHAQAAGSTACRLCHHKGQQAALRKQHSSACCTPQDLIVLLFLRPLPVRCVATAAVAE